MFGPTFKISVVFLLLIIVISLTIQIAGGQCVANCNNQDCPYKQKSMHPPPPKTCSNPYCEGECGKPECQFLPGKPLNRNGNHEEGCNDDDQRFQHGEHMPSKNSNKPSERPAPAGNYHELPVLIGNLDCESLTANHKKQAPLYTAGSEKSKPSKPSNQCTRCNLQLTDDNSAVIITCYECWELDTGCGTQDKVPSSPTTKPKSSHTDRTNLVQECQTQDLNESESERTVCADDNFLEDLESNKTLIAENIYDTQNSKQNPCEQDYETEEPSFCLLVNYIQIVNYTRLEDQFVN